MKNLSFFISLLTHSLMLNLSLSCISLTTSHLTNHDDFLTCLSRRINNSTIESRIIHTSQDSSYSTILNSSIQNPRFSVQDTPKPVSIITPVQTTDVQSTVICARLHNIHVRTRSGGHDYEGFSYIAKTKPFIVLDLRNLRSITFDVDNRTGWVQTGATIGELYFEIAKLNNSLAFPAGLFATVGVGGQFGGGGYGTLMRKHGLSADNVMDAHIIDANGRFLDRQGMGEDFFWAIRGGGVSSFCVVLSWKIRLVNVPLIVTVFSVTKTSEEDAVSVMNKWQYIASRVSNDLFIRAMLQRSNETAVYASFPGLYLGPKRDLVAVMEETFPELGLEIGDCSEMSWIESVLWFIGEESIDILAKRKRTRRSFKGKDDFIEKPIPRTAILELWRRVQAPEARLAKIILTPFGGKMSEIAENETPFPHRQGNLYEIQYLAYWSEEEDKNIRETEKYFRWVKSLYDFMTPYVSKSPRRAYVNFRDIDLGVYSNVETKYDQGKIWGVKYFNNNFDRLVSVKTIVDPMDFFCDEQSIPVLKSVNDI